MATDTLIPVIVTVLLFVSSGTSLSCDQIKVCIDDNDDIRSGWDRHCTLNSNYVTHCLGCRSMTNNLADNFTMKFSGASLNRSELLITDMTFENCAKPIIIEDMMSVEIRNVNFSGFTDSVLDIFNVLNVTVDNCIFVNNHNNGSHDEPFRGNAGAIAVGYSNCSNCSSSLLNSSTSANIIIKNSMFIKNSAWTNRSTDQVLIQKVFAGRGGAIALYLPTPESIVRFTSELNCFENNSASSAGGAIYAHLSGDFANVTLHVKECNFTGNEAPDGAGVEFTYNLDRSACVITSCEIDNDDCTSSSVCNRHIPANSIIEDCHFVRNVGEFGGAFKGIQINPFGNNNMIKFKNCTFINNSASVGAGAYFQSRYSVADVRMSNAIQMENCNFMGNVGARSIVFMIRNRVDFIGCNDFENNEGPSIRLVGTLVVFNGTVNFVNNRHHSEGLSGALYLSSFGQMLLAEHAKLNFTNNTGSDGAAIVVKSPRVSSSFSRQLYNPQCFLQYENPTKSPQLWDAIMTFAGNKARVGPVMFVSNLAACEWYSLDPAKYFVRDNMERWGEILDINEDDNCNCVMNSINNCSDSSKDCKTDSLIQTEVSELDVIEDAGGKSPGENVRVSLNVSDERNSSTIAFLKIDYLKDENVSTPQNCNVTFEPSIIPVSPEDMSINFKFRSTKQCENEKIYISVSAPFAINPVEPRQFSLTILPCLPGFGYEDTTDDYQQCNCDTQSDVLYCSPDQTAILLKDGTWAASPTVSGNRNLIISPCPAGYCKCDGLPELTRSGCALNFSESICVDDRKGWLCGECNQPCRDGEESGIGVLTTKCRCSEDDMYNYLVPLVVFYGLAATLIIVFVNYPFPSTMKGILYYVQVSAISTQFFPEDFNIKWEIMDCIASGLSFYFPYDFDFQPGLTAITAYGLRYIPIALVVIIAPIALWIRMRFHARMVFEGIWTLILLTYAHLVYASASIVNCRELDNELRWFINGTVQCYADAHLGLAFLAIISLMVTALLIIFTGFIIYHREIKYTTKFPHRVKTMAVNLRSTLINGYRPNYIFWPVVELLRRYIFILAVVLTPGDLTVPLLLMLVVFGAHVFVYPYEDKLSNHIESFVLFILITVLMLGNTTAVVEETRDTDTKEQFFVLLFIPIYLAILLFACCLVYKLCRVVQHRYNINFKSWNITKQSGLLNRMRSSPAPQVTCTHIDLGDHHYEPLIVDRDTEDSEQPRMRSSHSNDMED